MAMRYFNPRYNFVAPPELRIPEQYRTFCKENGIEYHEYEDMNSILAESDILYMTRVQQERFTDPMEYEKVRNTYSLHNALLEGTKDNLRILHPLPRITEIAEDVDNNPKAYYFEQAKNGVYARQAVICSILGLV
jgi:aspartate carbamoyltransferase catalytic subunit